MAGTAIRAMSKIVDVLIPRAQDQSTPGPLDDYWYEPKGGVKAGQAVTGHTALTFSGCWAATNTLAGLFGALPKKAYRKTDDGREEVSKHDVYRIISREPNPELDSFVFWEMMTQWWVNYGNAFAEIQRTSGSGRIVALWPIHPSRVKPERDANKNWTGRWVIKNNGEKDSYLNNDEVFNIVGVLSDDGIIGKGVLYYAAQSIGIGLAEGQYQGDFYGNGGRPSGILEHPDKLSPTARDQLRREWREVHGRSNEIAVLWEGLKFNPISVDPEHAELIESRTFSVQEMARFYDLPPHVLYELSNGTFANVEEMNRFLVSHSFNRRLVRVEKAMDRQLFSESEKRSGYYTKFNIDALLRGNPKEAAEIAAIEIGSGVVTQDEVREKKELNKLPDGLGSKHWMRRDLAPIDLVIKSADQASAPIPDTPPTPDKPPVPGEIDRLNKRVKSLRRKLDDEKKSKEDLQNRILELENVLGDNSRLEADLRSWKKKHEDHTEEIVRLAAEADSIRAECGDVVAERDNLAVELSSAKDVIRGLESTVSEQKAAIETEKQCKEAINTELKAVKSESESLANDRDALSSQLAASQKIAATLERQVEQAEQSLASAEADKELLVSQLEDAKEHVANLQSIHNISLETLAECERKLSDTEKQHESTLESLEASESTIETLKSELSEANEQISKAVSDSEQLRSEMQSRDRAFEKSLAKANSRGEEYKAKCESLSSEVGSLRAECDGMRTQLKAAIDARDKVANKLTEVQSHLEIERKAVVDVQKQVETAKNESKSRLGDARMTIASSIRSLLDESLQFLVSQEQHEVKTAARKPEQFKQIINGYYHHLHGQLVARLSQANSALESVGYNRVDVAKIASKYVNDSRTKLNNVFHTTPKADLRLSVRKEAESWEVRRHELTNWIGE